MSAVHVIHTPFGTYRDVAQNFLDVAILVNRDQFQTIQEHMDESEFMTFVNYMVSVSHPGWSVIDFQYCQENSVIYALLCRNHTPFLGAN